MLKSMKLNIGKRLSPWKKADKKTLKSFFLLYSLAFIYLMILSEKILFSLFLAFLSLLFLPYLHKELKLQKQKRIILEFQDFLYLFNGNLQAGKSIETSLQATSNSLGNIYFKESLLSKHLERIIYLNSIGISYEKGFYSLEDIYKVGFFKDLGNVIKIAKNQGGRYLDTLMATSNILGEKLETEREIETLLAKQNMEVKILRIIPLILLLALKFIYPDLIVFLTGSLLGIATFLGVVFIMIAALYISNKLMEVVW